MAIEVSARQAGLILGTSNKTVWKRVQDGKLPARLQGDKRLIFIEIGDLRAYAQENGYRFNEEMARKFVEE